jgi:hypothetical protein
VLVSGSVLVSVTLDDVPLRALLDSGTTQTLLAAAGMYHVDLRADMLDVDPGALVPGFGPQVPTLRRHRFRLLQVGPGRFARPTILAGSVRLNPTADMILGADYLATRRVWISFATRQVFVAE